MSSKTYSRGVKWCFALVLAFLLVGCQPVRTKPLVVHKTDVRPPEGEKSGSPALESGQTFDERRLRGDEFLWEAEGAPVPLQDKRVGRLNDDPSLTLWLQDILARLGTSLHPADLDPDWADYLTKLANRLKAAGLPVSPVRVGSVYSDDGTSGMVPVAVGDGQALWVGWAVVMTSPTGQRLLSDLRLDPAPGSPGPYDPESGLSLTSTPSRR